MANNDNNKDNDRSHIQLNGLLATVSASENGNILIWDFDYTNIPIGLMRGSNNNSDLCATSTCIDFQLLDCIKIFKDCKFNSEIVDNSSKTNSKVNKDKNNKNNSKKGATSNKSNNNNNKQNEEMLKSKFLLNKKIMITAMKDGKLTIHDLSNAYFPHRFISSSVTAISSQGHVAFHRGNDFLYNDSGVEVYNSIITTTTITTTSSITLLALLLLLFFF